MPLFHMKTIMNALCQGSAGSHKPQAPLSAPLIHFPTLPPHTPCTPFLSAWPSDLKTALERQSHRAPSTQCGPLLWAGAPVF